ncbi:helicase associated domain-containing protein [Streptomyces sp. NBC_01717]|nr:helicase associated domain-containing protein [Streptomyces sp. NBC_01717]
MAAARAFHHREGHLDGEPVRLEQWISNARRRKDRPPTERIRALDALGLR